MRTILEALRKGNEKEKLVVTANLTTIAGVSISTILVSMVTLVTMTIRLYLKMFFPSKYFEKLREKQRYNNMVIL